MKATVIAAPVVLAFAIGSTLSAQRSTPPVNRPPQRAAPVDSRSPLDRTRRAYLDDQAAGPGAATIVRVKLRDAHLWTLTDQRGQADLVVTIAQARPTVARGARQPQTGPTSYELTIRSARTTSGVPLWRGTAPTPEKLVAKLKADVAPDVCLVVWCW